jgi:uncharacterized protein involved in exopolysaccharide biosynthesis
MARPIDAFLYVGYMRSRWRFVAASCGIAVLLSVVFSLIQTRQYTATARILIEPPAGSDLRAAMAVSPIYLESLRTYEEFAAGDSLFRKALDQLNLRPLLGARPIESLKKSVLKVNLVRNTRILEIAATLPDASKSQALARFLAESTVALNRLLVADSDRDLLHGLDQQATDARARLDHFDTQWAHLLSSEPVEDLKSSMDSAADLRSKLQEEILSFEVGVVDASQREKEAAQREKQTGSPEAAQIRADIANAQARIAELHKQVQDLDREAFAREKLLAIRTAHRDELETERKSAQAGLASIETRLHEARADAGYRGERLQIIDPGIMPERPSSPNLPLNVAASLLAGLVLPILYLAIALNFLEQPAFGRRDLFEPALKGRRDERQ